MEIGCIISLALVYFGFEYTSEEVRTVVLDDNSVITEIDDNMFLKLKDDPGSGVEILDYIEVIDEVVEEEEIPFMLVEEKPTFQKGDANKFSKWVNQRLVYPEIFKLR